MTFKPTPAFNDLICCGHYDIATSENFQYYQAAEIDTECLFIKCFNREEVFAKDFSLGLGLCRCRRLFEAQATYCFNFDKELEISHLIAR